MNEEKHFTSSDTIRDIVIGMSDGLTVPFALAAGLSGAVTSNTIIITAGVAEIVAGSIAMALGGYLAGKTDVEHYQTERKREYEETDAMPETEKQEVMDILSEYGISPGIRSAVAIELSHDRNKWVDFMMRFELGLGKPDINRASRSALNIGLSYIAGGIVPLIGYFIMKTPGTGLIFSAITTVLFLLIFGFVKTKLTGTRPLLGALKTVLIGVLAAGAAYIIARIIA